MSQKQAKRIRKIEENLLLQRLDNKALSTRVSANARQISLVHKKISTNNKKPQRLFKSFLTKHKLKHSLLG